MLIGIAVGIALSTARALLQTITKNELADSGIIGINAGAATAFAVTLIYRVSISSYSKVSGALSQKLSDNFCNYKFYNNIVCRCCFKKFIFSN